jgi:hypothetical protein
MIRYLHDSNIIHGITILLTIQCDSLSTNEVKAVEFAVGFAVVAAILGDFRRVVRRRKLLLKHIRFVSPHNIILQGQVKDFSVLGPDRTIRGW